MPNDTWFEVGSTREIGDMKIPMVTGTATIESFVARNAKQSTPVLAKRAAHLRGERSGRGRLGRAAVHPRSIVLRASLAYLADRKVGELDWAFRTTLDAFSYRLDAWSTSLATRRMEQLRTAALRRVFISAAFGWVENLKLETQPDSLGYVHAPSLAQAATAAIMRSGHLANRERLAGAFNINLTSERTKRALGLIEGVANGQTPAVLFGYRFERGLRDALLGKYILLYRKRYPLRRGNDTATEPAESIAARDVVDGMALVTRWRESKPEVLAGIAAGDQAKLTALLNDLSDTWDAVSDVLTAEGVYQVVQGNLERAGAATGVLDNQTRPIDPQVTRTPRMGVSYAQRVAVVCESTQLPPQWSGIGATDPRAVAEPRLNVWIATMLGDPGRFEFTARVVRGDVVDANVLGTNPGKLGLSPLSLVLATRVLPGEQGAQHSMLRERTARALAASVPNPDANTTVLIDERHPQPGKLGLAEFEAVAVVVRHLIEGARPLTRKDVVALRDEIEEKSPNQGEQPGADLADIEARAVAALNALQTYAGNLKSAPDAATILARLREAWPFDLREAQSGFDLEKEGETIVSAEGAEDLANRRTRVLAQLDAKVAAAKALDPADPAQAGASHSQRVANAIERIKLVFGRDFPVLPRFTLGEYAGEVSASLADRNALLENDNLALAGWLPKLARVRDGADRLNAALSAREALVGIGQGEDFKVWQLPHRAGSRWAALPSAWKGQDPKKVVPHVASSRMRPVRSQRLRRTTSSQDSCATSGRNSCRPRPRPPASASITTHPARARPSPSCSQCRRR